MLESCVLLVHSTALRRRYRIDSATPIDWELLNRELLHLLPGNQLHIRINSSSRSVVFSLRNPEDNHYFLEAWQALTCAASRAGVTPREPEVIRVRVRVIRPPLLAWLRHLLLPLDIASFGAAICLVLLASLATVLGILGLLLPLAPGIPLLLLAYLLMEMAFALRRPFMRPAHGR